MAGSGDEMEAALVMAATPECDRALMRLLEHRIPAAEVVRVLAPYDVDDAAEVLYLDADLRPMTALCRDLPLDKPGAKPQVRPGW